MTTRPEGTVPRPGRPGRLYVVFALLAAAALAGLAAVGPRAAAARRVSKRSSRSAAAAAAAQAAAGPAVRAARPPMVVLGFNDLGMHCMNDDFSELCILPPYNNLHAQVIDRSGGEPHIVTSGVQVNYSIPGNTRSSTKTNFWAYAQKLFGLKAPLAKDVGLTGNKLSGKMTAGTTGDWAATGIPITPVPDAGGYNAFQLGLIQVVKSGKLQATTQAVVPVSWEISCNICHNTPGISVATDILRRHDRIHGTALEAQKSHGSPVLCAACHADPALGTKGVAGVKPMSQAMHGAHADRMAPAASYVSNTCYACHPGKQTECLRDVHFQNGMTCTDCHVGGMKALGNLARTAWVDEPKCGDCHRKTRPDLVYEEPGKLYKESRGHNGVKCASCHGSPHAITPTVVPADNVQAIALQGRAGTINDCKVCHTAAPDDRFNHSRGD